jgi:hypothetical protein
LEEKKPNDHGKPRRFPEKVFQPLGHGHDDLVPSVVSFLGIRRIKMGNIRHDFSFQKTV